MGSWALSGLQPLTYEFGPLAGWRSDMGEIK